MEMRNISDEEWLAIYSRYFGEIYRRERNRNASPSEAIGQAFQETVDLEFHPYFPVQRPINQRVMTEWGEKHKQMLNEEIHIAIINTEPDNIQVGIIKVKREWLLCDFPQWLIDNEHFNYFQEIPNNEDELIEFFLLLYCEYSPDHLHWHEVPADTQLKRLTIKDFQK